jgi:endonuclease III
MTSASRSAQFTKLFKALKKCYRPAPSNAGRSVMEHLLFACCLEDAHHDAAEEAFAAMVHTFFDWNEVRVTSISELSEVLSALPDPRAAANRVKRVLHAVFEATFAFDLEENRKKNLGPTVAWLEKLDGTTRFTVAYVVQAALGGHSIPIDAGTMAVLRVLDMVSEQDAAAGLVPGLERAIPKSKGAEFGSLLHELGADYSANPYASSLRAMLLQIDPEVGSRLPKRRLERPAGQKPATAAQGATPQASGKPAADGAAPSAEPSPKAEGERKAEKKKGPSRDESRAAAAADRPKKKAAPSPRAPAKSDKARHSESPPKKSASEGLSKRKPR